MDNNHTFAWILMFALGAMLVNTAGIYVIWRNKRWAEKKHSFISFFMGVSLALALMFIG